MSASFTVRRLVDGRTFVSGEDRFGETGTTTVDSTQWDQVKDRQRFSRAEEDFDAAVEKFFAPITEAAEKMESAVERPTDPITTVVFKEAVDGEPGQAGDFIKLSRDSIVLRLIEEGNYDRLVWVDGHLEVLEQTTPRTSGGGSQVSDDQPA